MSKKSVVDLRFSSQRSGIFWICNKYLKSKTPWLKRNKIFLENTVSHKLNNFLKDASKCNYFWLQAILICYFSLILDLDGSGKYQLNPHFLRHIAFDSRGTTLYTHKNNAGEVRANDLVLICRMDFILENLRSTVS